MTMHVRTQISAVIPCRNAARFLGETLASVRAQTRPVAEVIVIDDASEDDSATVAQQFGAHVIRLATRRGHGAARNAGLRAATAEFIALLDADDVWLPHHCETVAALLEQHLDACAAFGAMRVIGDGEGTYPPWIDPGPPQWLFERCLVSWIGMTTPCILRRSRALAIGGFDEGMPLAVDFDMWLRLATRSPFVATHEVTALYRRHADQISNNRILQDEMRYLARYRAWQALVNQRDVAAATRAARIILDLYTDDLQAAWEAQDREVLRSLLRCAKHVPGGDAARRKWSRRSAIPKPLVEMYFATGEEMRKPVRNLIRWLESRAR
jgi:glycosyltransferase involved in cell wall biosynthesis